MHGDFAMTSRHFLLFLALLGISSAEKQECDFQADQNDFRRVFNGHNDAPNIVVVGSGRSLTSGRANFCPAFLLTGLLTQAFKG